MKTRKYSRIIKASSNPTRKGLRIITLHSLNVLGLNRRLVVSNILK